MTFRPFSLLKNYSNKFGVVTEDDGLRFAFDWVLIVVYGLGPVRLSGCREQLAVESSCEQLRAVVSSCE